MKTVALIPLLVIAIPLSSKQRRPSGEIDDRAAFAKVGSYCVDPSDLPGPEAHVVSDFLTVEGKPGHLLSKVPWKFLSDCRESDPDAVIKLEFPRLRVYSVDLGEAPGSAMPNDQTPELFHIVAILKVQDAGSLHLLYKVQADPLSAGSQENEAQPVLRRNAMYNAFGKLAQDVRFTSRNQSSHPGP